MNQTYRVFVNGANTLSFLFRNQTAAQVAAFQDALEDQTALVNQWRASYQYDFMSAYMETRTAFGMTLNFRPGFIKSVHVLEETA